MGKLEVKIKTLTPLWTGGVDTTMDRLHETGILGSLRWWYEVLVRGLGGYACDPTEHKCSFDADKYRKSKALDERQRLKEAGLCDTCQVFGATGWRRRFRLEVVDETKPIWDPPDKMLNIRPPGRTRGWYLLPGKMGTLTLRFTGDPRVLSLMAALLLFLEKWGSLGAKPQLGYGVFEIKNRDEAKVYAVTKWEPLGDRTPGRFPELRCFGFFKYRFSPSSPGWWTRVPGMERMASLVQPLVRMHNTVPVAPVLKNEWRFHQWQGSRKDEVEIFGTLRPERKRSKVVVSWAYQHNGVWEMRGWAWLAAERWVSLVWNVLADQSVWERVLGTRGTLYVCRPQQIEDVLEMLAVSEETTT